MEDVMNQEAQTPSEENITVDVEDSDQKVEVKEEKPEQMFDSSDEQEDDGASGEELENYSGNHYSVFGAMDCKEQYYFWLSIVSI